MSLIQIMLTTLFSSYDYSENVRFNSRNSLKCHYMFDCFEINVMLDYSLLYIDLNDIIILKFICVFFPLEILKKRRDIEISNMTLQID